MARQVVSFHYKVTDDRGGKVDSSEGQAPLTFLEGAGQIIPGLEKALVALKKGDKKIIAVTAAEATEVSMDGNHPLAGQNLIFDVQVMEIRPATEDELKHGHAHGEGGHGH